MQAKPAGPQFDVWEYWAIAVRRKWLVMSAIAVSLAIAVTLCLVLPKSYRSSILILVENQKIPERYVQGVVEGSVQDRLTLIQQQVTSRAALAKVVDDLKLYSGEEQRGSREALISHVRKNVRVETRGGGRGQVLSFSISFAHEDPMMAMKVTEKLATQFIEENLKMRELFVEDASEFLELELRSAKETVEQKEKVITEFKGKYLGELPGQLDANLRTLDRLQAEVPPIHEAMSTLNDRLAALDREIGEYKTAGTTSSGSQRDQNGDPLLARLKELERNLANLSAEYKETYPDILMTKHEIQHVKALMARRSKVTKDEEEPAASSIGSNGGAAHSSSHADPFLLGLKKQRLELQAELDSERNRLTRLKAHMRDYEGRVERTPAREQELMILLRDYDSMQKHYQSLLDKKVNARIAENLEKRRKSEQFRILEPAYVPQAPDSPDKFRILLAGLALGCGVGYGGAFALERVNAAFRRPEDVEETLGLPVLAEIPAFSYAYDRSAQRLLPSTSLAVGSGGTRLLEDGHASTSGPAAWGEVSRRDQTTSKWKTSARALSPERNLVSKWNPTSVVAEQFRVAATRLALMGVERTSTIIVVTSAVKGEGKSSTLLNLGYVLAHDLEKSTLIIDADLKQPVMHGYAGVPQTPGLAEILHGDQPLDRCLRRVGEASLWLVPSGSVRSKHVDLAKMKQLTALLREVRSRYEYILVDAPPILPLADMNVLAGLADVLVLVVRAGVTGRDVVQKALRKLKPTTDAGVILTGAWVDSMPYYLQGYGYAEVGKGRHA